MRQVLGSLLLTAILSTPAADAAELVSNGSFAGGFNGWDSGMLFDPSLDATGVAGSGSARLEWWDVRLFGFWILAQCVSLDTGTNFQLGGKIRIEGGHALPNPPRIVAAFLGGPNCSGPYLGGDALYPDLNVTDAWQPLQSAIRPRPAGTQSVLLGVWYDPGWTPTFNVDDITFQSDRLFSPSVPALGSTGLLALVLALAVAGALTLRRLGG